MRLPLLHRLRLMLLAIGLSAMATLPGVQTQAAVVPWGTVLIPGSQWAGSYAGLGDLNVYSNGSGNTDQSGPYGPAYECTELATRWAALRYGVSPRSWNVGAAYQMFDAAPRIHWEALPNGGPATPHFGDLLVFDRTSYDPTGHVAVVSGTGPTYVDIVEQNWGNSSPTGTARLPISGTAMPARWGLTIRGWLRPSSGPFVQAVYPDALGRPADAAGMAYWTSQIDRGLTRQHLALTMEYSPEGRLVLVRAEYARLLRRSTDAGGAAYWAQYLLTHSVQQFEASIIGPPEYFVVEGGNTNAGFVGAIYADALGRPADAGGLAYFTRQVDLGMPYAQVAAGLIGSPEASQHLVSTLYTTILRRTADAGGLAYNALLLSSGRETVQQLRADFLGSDEYLAWASAR